MTLHNALGGISPKIQTFLTGQGAQDQHHCFTGLAGRGRQGQAGQHSLATGGVHQQRDESRGGWADAVQCQHGVFALLFTDDVI